LAEEDAPPEVLEANRIDNVKLSSMKLRASAGAPAVRGPQSLSTARAGNNRKR
jgi:hypothetical protein